MLLIVAAAVTQVCIVRTARWRRDYELSIDRLIRAARSDGDTFGHEVLLPDYGFLVSCFPVKIRSASAGWSLSCATEGFAILSHWPLGASCWNESANWLHLLGQTARPNGLLFYDHYWMLYIGDREKGRRDLR